MRLKRVIIEPPLQPVVFFCIWHSTGAILIRLDHIDKTYHGQQQSFVALRDVSLSVAEGEIFGVIGPSGAGKSTLIRCVNLLERPSSGSVTVAGQSLLSLSVRELRVVRHQIGMVFQHFNLLSSRTVFDNVAFQLHLLGRSASEVETAVMTLLSLTGLADKRDAYPSQLSGGQKQRVAIARALVTRPKLLLCDEMTSALDPDTTQSILDLLKRLQRELSLTILLITHEMDVIKRIADRVAVMVEGQIVETTDVVSLFKNPQTAVAKQFIRSDLKRYLPDDIKSVLRASHCDGDKTLVQIAFVGQVATQPIIAQLINHSTVQVNILQANLECLRNETIGVMTLDLEGDHADVLQALQYLKQQGLQVEVIGYVPRTVSTARICESANT